MTRSVVAQRFLIGLTGPNAAGKGEVAARLVDHGFTYHSLSDVLRDALTSRGLEPTRERLIAEGNALREKEGPAALAGRIAARLGRRDIIDSIRVPAEVERLGRLEGFILLGIDAPVEDRFRRAINRGRPGEGATFDEFREKEARENSPDPARQQLARTFAMADHTLSNDGTLEDLRERVDRWLVSIGAVDSGSPQ